MEFAFDDYVLDSDRRELNRGVEAISVGPQVFDLLAHLLRNRHRVVSKDELIDSIWGGRIVSESTFTSHINAVRKAVGDTGEDQRLVRTIARKGYRFVGDVRESSPMRAPVVGPALVAAPPSDAPPATPALVLPERPSIAVLPFVNLSGDPAQEYFVDGVVEDIISAMSRMRGLFVIARNSSFTYKNRAVDVKQVGRELGVRYLVEGSMRKATNRVRITSQLVDAITGISIWSERFEGLVDNIFELQDQMTVNVVGAIAPHLEQAEIERAKHKPTGNLDAYDYYLRGMANLHKGTKESVEEATRLFQQAIEFDGEYAAAHGMAAWCYVWRKLNGWIKDRDKEFAEGERLARRAIDLGMDDAVALTRAGHALAHFAGDLDASISLLDRAKTLNPNLVAAWFLSGFVRDWRGDPEGAVEHFTHAMRLSPLDPEMYRMQAGMAIAHIFAGRFKEAAIWAKRAYREMPAQLMVASASFGLAGRLEEARQAMERLRQLDPTLRSSNVTKYVPISRPQDVAVFAEGLRRAGLPD